MLLGLSRASLACAVLAVLSAACGVSDRDVSDRSRRRPRFAGSGGSAAAGAPAAGTSSGGKGGNVSVGGASGGGSVAGTTVDPGGGGGGVVAMPPPFDAGTADDRNMVMPGELCERFATIQCAGEGSCCPSAGRDFETCKSALKGVCSADLLFDEIAKQAPAGYDAPRTRTFLDELERLASTCDPGTIAFGESLQGVRAMFAGTVAPGGSCRPNNLLNKSQQGAALFACTMPEASACLPSTLTWTCTPLAGPGGACFSDFNCQAGLFCPNPRLDITGATCQARKAEGASCEAGNECVSLYCSAGKCVPPNVMGAYCPE